MAKAVIGIMGGTGIYEMEGITDLREERVTTPFGDPSDAYLLGRLDEHPVAFLARHGRGHRLLPSELNFRGEHLWLQGPGGPMDYLGFGGGEHARRDPSFGCRDPRSIL